MLSGILALTSCSKNKSYSGLYEGYCTVTHNGNSYVEMIEIPIYEDAQGDFFIFRSDGECAEIYASEEIYLDRRGSVKYSTTYNSTHIDGFGNTIGIFPYAVEIEIDIHDNEMTFNASIDRCEVDWPFVGAYTYKGSLELQ